MSKYRPDNHIIGKVYDLTQDNMNALIKEVERLTNKLGKYNITQEQEIAFDEYERAVTKTKTYYVSGNGIDRIDFPSLELAKAAVCDLLKKDGK